MSRHRFDVATSHTAAHIATSNLCCDAVSAQPKQTRSRLQFHVATSWRLTYVATSTSCRDLIPAHNEISRSCSQKPGRDLPHCYPCRDLKNDVATSTQLSPITATSRRHFSMSQPLLLPPMLRPQNDVATSIPTGQNPRSSILRPTATQPGRDATSWSRPHVQPNQVATSNPCRDLNRS